MKFVRKFFVRKKIIQKLAAPQICLVLCLALISFFIINSSFTKMRERYVNDVIESRFQFIEKGMEASAEKCVSETSLFVHLPVVMEAYDIALGGNINDPYSPESQAARELLRKELAVYLDSHHKVTGKKLNLHFHLPSGLSLVRLWQEKNTKVNGEWVDISDDLSAIRQMVTDVNRTGRTAKGLEAGIGGFTIRGVIPVMADDGRQLGSAEVLQEFDPLLQTAIEDGKVYVSMYVNKNLLDFSIELQDQEKYPVKGDFIRIFDAKNASGESLITSELLSKGKNSVYFEDHSKLALVAYPLNDYRGNQVGILVFEMNTSAIAALANRAAIILSIILAGIAFGPALVLLQRANELIVKPLNKIKAKIVDISQDRADLGDWIPCTQNDEIGDLAMEFNTLTSKMRCILWKHNDVRSQNTESAS